MGSPVVAYEAKTFESITDEPRDNVSALDLSYQAFTSWIGFSDAISRLLRKPSYLSVLDLSHNQLTSIDISLLSFKRISTLNLSHNLIADIQETSKLANLTLLSHLYLEGNPIEITLGPEYRRSVIARCGKGLKHLDRINITVSERRPASAARPTRPRASSISSGQSRPTSAAPAASLRPSSNRARTPVMVGTRPASVGPRAERLTMTRATMERPTVCGTATGTQRTVQARTVVRTTGPLRATARPTPTAKPATHTANARPAYSNVRPSSVTRVRARTPTTSRPRSASRVVATPGPQPAPEVSAEELLEVVLLQAEVALGRLKAFEHGPNSMERQLAVAVRDAVQAVDNATTSRVTAELDGIFTRMEAELGEACTLDEAELAVLGRKVDQISDLIGDLESAMSSGAIVLNQPIDGRVLLAAADQAANEPVKMTEVDLAGVSQFSEALEAVSNAAPDANTLNSLLVEACSLLLTRYSSD
ncbi:Leucine rich repeat [Carpediemonas membranifera]|uniref:Leucine-rich repeat-containing protein 51 n=1 Tax=Carpediemonas membranifera TaxID=201153 RepID=A0A8J6BUI8_9EUKA|nr:Leucine rich repeat [Carpediemonas membranifera]|eukprot:KAG9390396.1 Leucine rich repeat [Carpediemonas membranifera]